MDFWVLIVIYVLWGLFAKFFQKKESPEEERPSPSPSPAKDRTVLKTEDDTQEAERKLKEWLDKEFGTKKDVPPPEKQAAPPSKRARRARKAAPPPVSEEPRPQTPAIKAASSAVRIASPGKSPVNPLYHAFIMAEVFSRPLALRRPGGRIRDLRP
jgi:hypothetical protein